VRYAIAVLSLEEGSCEVTTRNKFAAGFALAVLIGAGSFQSQTVSVSIRSGLELIAGSGFSGVNRRRRTIRQPQSARLGFDSVRQLNAIEGYSAPDFKKIDLSLDRYIKVLFH
jgi:hypothetical protein